MLTRLVVVKQASTCGQSKAESSTEFGLSCTVKDDKVRGWCLAASNEPLLNGDSLAQCNAVRYSHRLAVLIPFD